MIKAPFPYFGGKSRIASLVWSRFGDPKNYVEPFAGSLAVLLGRPSQPQLETVNDLDAFLSNFWRAVQADPDAVAEHANWPVNENDLHARHIWLVTYGRQHVERLVADPDYYDARIAGWWVWGISQWIAGGWCSGQGPWHLVDGKLIRAQGDEAGIVRSKPYLSSGSQGIHVARVTGDEAGIKRSRPHLASRSRGIHVARVTGDEAGITRKRSHLTGRQGIHARSRANLFDYMAALQTRLRRVRVCCGDWTRVVTPTVAWKRGMTAVFLDPPYAFSERDSDLYAEDHDVSVAVRDWAVANGDNPLLRIALCGYRGEHEMPETWEAVSWKTAGGYGNQAMGRSRGMENARREMIWFSPACLRPAE